MIYYLGLGKAYPFLKIVGEVYYYGIILGSIIFFLYLAAKRLLELDYPKKKVILFTLLSIAMSFPAGYLGSRGATMFYRPMSQWSFSYFFDQMLHGTSHTFHASLILPLVFGALFCLIFKLRFREVFDSIYLYMPLAHVFGRSACMVCGCCWGHHVNLHVWGFDLSFQNPMPLYAMGSNLLLFFFLRRMYTHIYADPWTRARYQGSVLATYYLLYPAIRIIYEIFRREKRIFMGFTQAQFAMGLYMLFATILFLAIWYLYKKQTTAADAPGEVAVQSRQEIHKLFSLAGLLISYLAALFIFYTATRQLNIWPFPFHRVFSLTETYSRILYYLPYMIVPAYSLYWLKRNGLPVWEPFKWQRFSPYFLLALALSIYYALDLTVFSKNIRFQPWPFWVPVMVLSVMNAIAEEVWYRQTLYSALRNMAYSKWIAIPLQAIFYAIIHFMIAGALFGIFAFIYGVVLGLLADRSKSILPGIICHFIIDIGCIGMPMMRM